MPAKPTTASPEPTPAGAFVIPGERRWMVMTGINPRVELTGSQIAKVLGVSRQLVHSWHRTGKLPRTPEGLYRLCDATEVEHATRRSPTSTRRTTAAA
jgi:hypothetical protein